MAAKAQAKFIRMSPRKVRLLIDLVRGLQVDDAKKQLLFSRKHASKPVIKVLDSAVANAKNNLGLDTTSFVVTKAFVDEGPTFYRYTPRAQGRATPIRKRTSHITIEVGPKEDSKGGEQETVVPEKKTASKKAKKVEESQEIKEKPSKK